MRQAKSILGAALAAATLVAAGCGGGGGGSSAGPAPVPAPPANASPTVSSVPDQSVDEDGISEPIKMVVGDAETAPADLDVSVSAADPLLLPADGIEMIADGADLTLTLVPAPGQSGITDVTVTVTDAAGASTSTTFGLDVRALFRAEFSNWLRGTVLARGALDQPVGAPQEDGSVVGDTEAILRISFSDDSAEDPAAYDDLIPDEEE